MSTEARHPIFSLLGFLALTFGTGFIATQGALRGLGGWYQILEKPSWTLPPWLFAPIWTVLYATIALSGWIIWRTDSPSKRPAIALFVVQIVFNAVWTWLFFALHQLFASAVEIAILWIAIGLTIFFFSRINKSAGLLLLPYLAWALYASALSFAIWRLNSAGAKVQVISQPTALLISNIAPSTATI